MPIEQNLHLSVFFSFPKTYFEKKDDKNKVKNYMHKKYDYSKKKDYFIHFSSSKMTDNEKNPQSLSVKENLLTCSKVSYI